LPKDIALKVSKDQDWYASYAWVNIPGEEMIAESVDEEQGQKKRA